MNKLEYKNGYGSVILVAIAAPMPVKELPRVRELDTSLQYDIETLEKVQLITEGNKIVPAFDFSLNKGALFIYSDKKNAAAARIENLSFLPQGSPAEFIANEIRTQTPASFL